MIINKLDATFFDTKTLKVFIPRYQDPEVTSTITIFLIDPLPALRSENKMRPPVSVHKFS